jgi:hypothetical protein
MELTGEGVGVSCTTTIPRLPVLNTCPTVHECLGIYEAMTPDSRQKRAFQFD